MFTVCTVQYYYERREGFAFATHATSQRDSGGVSSSDQTFSLPISHYHSHLAGGCWA
jgi:hypothetical protein